MSVDLSKVLQDGKTIVENAIAAAPGGGFVTMAIADATALRDLLDQAVLALPPIDAPALDPTDRADVDAEVDAELAKS